MPDRPQPNNHKEEGAQHKEQGSGPGAFQEEFHQEDEKVGGRAILQGRSQFAVVEREKMNKDAVDVDRRSTMMEAEKAILGAYARGVLSRGVAMEQLGLDWYGDLLQRMNTHGIERPSVIS